MLIHYISPKDFEEMDKNDPIKKRFTEKQKRDKAIRQEIDKIPKNIPVKEQNKMILKIYADDFRSNNK